jgi:adenine deaminase
LTIDGHAPSVTGEDLNAYVLAGVETDHECVEADELIEKIKRGMYVHLREGSQTKNVIDLLKGVKPAYYERILFCSDDLHPSDIETSGHIDKIINLAIKGGIKPENAISMATINIANCYKLRKVGAIAPGYKADLVVFKNLDEIEVVDVFKAGKLVVKNKVPMFKAVGIDAFKVMNTVNVNQEKIDLDICLKSDLVNVIGLIRNNVTTRKLREKIILKDGHFLPKSNPDLLKLCVIERHKGTGNVGKGIVRGYGLENGALAMTIAHDSHNLICLGDNDEDMLLAIDKIKEIGGGIVLASKGKISEYLALEVGGLMSLNSGEYVRGKLDSLEKKIRSLGVKEEIEDPFLQLAFLSLAVIPELKVTDLGLFDVNTFTVIPIEAGDES